MSVTFRDNSQQFLNQFNRNKIKALTAIGQAAVEVTNDYMQHKYGRPIYQTGDLMRSIDFKVRPALSMSRIDAAVDVGSNLEYAEFVFLGTRKMPARPALQDAVLDNKSTWQEIAAEHLGEGMEMSVRA